MLKVLDHASRMCDGVTRRELMRIGGIKQWAVHGTSDAIGAYPASHPVSPGDIVATIYHQLGIDPHLMLPDVTGRPTPVAHGGTPIWEIIDA